MNITEITDDNMSLCNCTNDNNDMILEISPLFLIIAIIPCFLSIMCGVTFMICSFLNCLKNKI